MNIMSSEYPVLVSPEQQYSLSDKVKFEIGRSTDADLVITSSFVSRRQCTVFKENGGWLVVNRSSQKTTLINGVALEDKTCHSLKDGDKISFMRYHGDIVFSTGPTPKNVDTGALRQEYENKLNELQNSVEFGALQITKLLSQASDQQKQLEEYTKKEKSATEKINELTERIRNLERQKAELGLCCSEQKNELKELMTELNRKQKEEIDNHCSLGGTICKPEALQDMIESELLKTELLQKEAKLKELNDLYSKVSEERDARFELFLSAFESEMSCCVCSDIIYEATILNCKHTFCKACLNEWKKTRKECPECRTKIKSEVRNLKIDAFIERVTPCLGPSYVSRREEIIKERSKPPPPSVGPIRSRGNRGNRRSGPYSLDPVSLDVVIGEAYSLVNDALGLQGNLYPPPSLLPTDSYVNSRGVIRPRRRQASSRRSRGNNREM